MAEPNHVSWRDAGLRSFVHNHIASSGQDRNNSLVLADYLQDHEDPRAEIARRHGESGDSGEAFNPEGKRLYVKSHESYIPLTPSDKMPGWVPFQSVRVHVYGVNPGKDRPVSQNWRLEEARKQASAPVAVRLAFSVTDNQQAGGDRKSSEWGGWFSPHEAVRLANRFHPETAAAIKKVIIEGFGGNLPSEEQPTTPPSHPDDIDHNVSIKQPSSIGDPAKMSTKFSEPVKYDDAVALAAYAHLRAAGDHAACKRLRKLVCGEAEEFADPPEPPPSSPPPPPAFNPNRPSSSTLAALMKQARVDPENAAGHGMIADQLDEEHPGNKISELIRKQYGVGEHGGQGEANNLWHDALYAGYDNTHPYMARLGRHGPFDLYLGHEGSENMGSSRDGGNARWILRAASRLPGSQDVAYNFELPHERAHEIPQMFPAAAQQGHINPTPHLLSGLGSITSSPTFNLPAYLRSRAAEALQFDSRMAEEERARE